MGNLLSTESSNTGAVVVAAEAIVLEQEHVPIQHIEQNGHILEQMANQRLMRHVAENRNRRDEILATVLLNIRNAHGSLWGTSHSFHRLRNTLKNDTQPRPEQINECKTTRQRALLKVRHFLECLEDLLNQPPNIHPQVDAYQETARELKAHARELEGMLEILQEHLPDGVSLEFLTDLLDYYKWIYDVVNRLPAMHREDHVVVQIVEGIAAIGLGEPRAERVPAAIEGVPDIPLALENNQL